MRELLPFKRLRQAMMLCLLMTVANTYGQYSGSGTFNKITAVADLTDGYYVIVNSTTEGFAMNNTHNGTFLANTVVTPASGTLTNPSTAIVWRIATDGAGRTIFNEGTSKYVSFTGSSNNVQVVDAVAGNNQRWTITYSGGMFLFNNTAVAARRLQYNSGSPRFACYTGSQQDLQLYKLAPPANVAPVASNVQITGLPNTGVQLSGTHDFADADNDFQGASVKKWYAADDASGTNTALVATAATYTLSRADLGKYIRLGVTPVALTGTSPGTEAFSTWIGPVVTAGTPIL